MSCVILYEELKTATRNFHPRNKIGEGAFGAMYKVKNHTCHTIDSVCLPHKWDSFMQEFLWHKNGTHKQTFSTLDWFVTTAGSPAKWYRSVNKAAVTEIPTRQIWIFEGGASDCQCAPSQHCAPSCLFPDLVHPLLGVWVYGQQKPCPSLVWYRPFTQILEMSLWFVVNAANRNARHQGSDEVVNTCVSPEMTCPTGVSILQSQQRAWNWSGKADST